MALQEVSQMVMDANTITTIANNINSLYSNAINQLTSYTLGVVALVGILIPVLVTVIQWRSLKTEKEILEKHINAEIAKAKSLLRIELEAEMKQLVVSEESNLISRIEKKITKLENQLLVNGATSYHLQGNSEFDKGLYESAAQDYCKATTGYLRGCDELNASRTLKLLLESLTQLNETYYEFNDLIADIDALITFLKEINSNRRYDDIIREIKYEMESAKLRIHPQT